MSPPQYAGGLGYDVRGSLNTECGQIFAAHNARRSRSQRSANTILVREITAPAIGAAHRTDSVRHLFNITIDPRKNLQKAAKNLGFVRIANAQRSGAQRTVSGSLRASP